MLTRIPSWLVARLVPEVPVAVHRVSGIDLEEGEGDGLHWDAPGWSDAIAELAAVEKSA